MISVDKILGQILNAGQAVDSNPFDGKSEGKPFDGKSLAGGLLMGGLAGAMMGKTGKKSPARRCSWVVPLPSRASRTPLTNATAPPSSRARQPAPSPHRKGWSTNRPPVPGVT